MAPKMAPAQVAFIPRAALAELVEAALPLVAVPDAVPEALVVVALAWKLAPVLAPGVVLGLAVWPASGAVV